MNRVYRIEGAGPQLGRKVYIRKGSADRAARIYNEGLLSGLDDGSLATVVEFELRRLREYNPSVTDLIGKAAE